MIVERIRKLILIGAIIPKPEAKADFVVKAWGRRRGEAALVYSIPNHGNPSKPHEKGITESEFVKAFVELQERGEFTHAWFKKHMPHCAKEGDCNFTTIGGVFQLLGDAIYAKRGVYELLRK